MSKGMKLTAKQSVFVDEYLVDLNATQAAIRAGYSAANADKIGAQLLGKTGVAAAIAERMQARAERTEITADMVLQRWWQLANADVNELIQYRRLCCRFCWGIDHQYQWTEEEFEQATARYMKLLDSPEQIPEPSNAGGFGFDSKRDPHEGCPECRGEGVGEVHVNDSRKLKGAARLLYAGVKATKEGLEVKMRDQDKALENVARHLGMFTENIRLTGKDGEALGIAVRFV